MTTAWLTADEVLAARAELEASMPGWRTPAAYALGVASNGGDIDWRVTNHANIHQLPAVVLGKVLGYRNGSATYWLDHGQLDEAIAMLSPAGACEAFEHPNLWAWQQLRSEISEGSVPLDARIVVVFIGDEADPPADDAQLQLRAALGLERPG
jgi:hypothetical protein